MSPPPVCLPMKIWIDTRQKKHKHDNIDLWFSAHGVEYEYKKLDFGDYMRDGSNVSIDSKQDLAEVCANVGRDHKRFVRECDRAVAAGYRLYILVEQGGGYRCVDDVRMWTNPVCIRCARRKNGECRPHEPVRCARYRSTPMQGRTLAKIMAGIEVNHGCKWLFCNKRQTARIICDLLGVKYERE